MCVNIVRTLFLLLSRFPFIKPVNNARDEETAARSYAFG